MYSKQILNSISEQTDFMGYHFDGIIQEIISSITFNSISGSVISNFANL